MSAAKRNHSFTGETPVCIIPLAEPVAEQMVAEKQKSKDWNKTDDLLEIRGYNGIARDLTKIGRSVCGNSCGIECALKLEYLDHPRSAEKHTSVEIMCGKRRCRNVGVVAVSAHVLKLARSQKILRKIKKVKKRR